MKENKMSKLKTVTFLLMLFAALFFIDASAQSDKLNQLVNDRNDLLNQLDEMGVNEKTFKNKKALMDYQTLIKKIIDLDAQIIGQANYEIDQKEKARADMQKQFKDKKSKTVYVENEKPDIGLDSTLNLLQGQNETLDAQLKAKSQSINELLNKNDSIGIAYKASLAKQEKLIIDFKNSEDKNLLLIFFNSILLMVLIGVLAYVLRKPKKKVYVQQQTQQLSPEIPMMQESVKAPQPTPKEVKREEPKLKINSDGIVNPSYDSVDLKLEQIEKLAKLREKGYLTDDEFAFQKRQILGS
jgi:hypothetical protein